MKPKHAQEFVDGLLSRWADGFSYREIGKDVKMPLGTIAGIIQRSSGTASEKAKGDHYLNAPARHKARKTGKRRHPELDERIAARWKEGKTAVEVGSDLGVTANVVIGVVHRNKIDRPPVIKLASRSTAQTKSCTTKLAKSERQRDETAQAMVERRAAGKLLRQEPRLELVSSVELLPREPEPEPDLYAHLRTNDGLRKALEAMIVPRDIISEQHK